MEFKLITNQAKISINIVGTGLLPPLFLKTSYISYPGCETYLLDSTITLSQSLSIKLFSYCRGAPNLICKRCFLMSLNPYHTKESINLLNFLKAVSFPISKKYFLKLFYLPIGYIHQ